ncbi:nitrous oxide reductase accessory protein NosL [Arcobacter sp. FWKO B]|uniref:nitrous oxide reductase accessory protein NosL n=1 Tax=Arcobacter sp. FWKO B TaxID=2593672 RepID=UPI0019030938|nr:nitrous oxide reductase accessory protein NosL [Arcobacter sp. FWKO B]
MVNFIKRDNSDIFSRPILRFIFKNPKFLFSIRIIVLAIFLYAVYYGFSHPTKENIFTGAVFWGLFWALFMVSTLPTFGRIFCGICPHGFIGKYITKFGLKRNIPKWLQNRYIGIFLLVVGWWGIYYTFPGFWKSPLATAGMFGGMTAIAFLFYYLYKDMSYCKYICPIGSMCRAYDKLSFTKLETYTDTCKDCRTFECAKACPYDLKPFTFAKKNSMDDCTLCMECANSCEAVKFKFTKPSQKLFDKFKTINAEIWVYILILASIPVSMTFAHGLDRSNISDTMIWNQTAQFFGMSSYSGGFAFVYAIVFTVFFTLFGIYLASKALKKDFSTTFSTLGYAFAPLFILSSLGHTLETFFIKDYQTIIQGFSQAFGFGIADVSPLAKRGDAWLSYLGLLKWLGIIWTLILLYIRLKLIDSSKIRKVFAYIFASLLVIFFIGINMYRGYIFETYGAKTSSHSHSHGGTKEELFQSVPFKDATLLQDGKGKTSCSVCGMNLPQYYKTNHSAKLDGKIKQYCSIHCLCEDLLINKLPLSDIQVVDVKSLKFLDVRNAFYVVKSTKPATMSMVSKYAFEDKEEALVFIQENGGEIVDFDSALKLALEDFIPKKRGKPNGNTSITIKDNQAIFFTPNNPQSKGGGRPAHSHGGGNKNEIPTKKLWLVFGDLDIQNIANTEILGFYYDKNRSKQELILNPKEANYSFEIPNNGYYNIYAVSEIISNYTLYHKVAKFEYLHGSHANKDKFGDIDKEILISNEVKFDLVRLKSDEEDNFFYKNYMGEELVFKALFDNQPLANADINIKLNTGWSKNIKTDQQGIAKFHIIKDYFPKWNEFDKRYKEDLLIAMTYEQDSQNENYFVEKYILTYPISFYPATSDYKSYAYGLFIGFIVLLFGIFLVYKSRTLKKDYQNEVVND